MSFVVGDTEVTSLGAAIALLQSRSGASIKTGKMSAAARKLAAQPGALVLAKGGTATAALVPAAPPSAGMSTGMKVGLGLLALVVLYFALRKKKKPATPPVHDTAETV